MQFLISRPRTCPFAAANAQDELLLKDLNLCRYSSYFLQASWKSLQRQL